MSKEKQKKQAEPGLKSGATAHSPSNYDGQECESLKLGNQARLAEPVVDAKANTTAHQAGKDRRFQATNEPSQAPKAADNDASDSE